MEASTLLLFFHHRDPRNKSQVFSIDCKSFTSEPSHQPTLLFLNCLLCKMGMMMLWHSISQESTLTLTQLVFIIKLENKVCKISKVRGWRDSSVSKGLAVQA